MLAFKRDEPSRGVADVVRRMRETARRHRIRCPSCGWQPGATSRWGCVTTAAPEHFGPGCGTEWNTFDTQGRCPGCAHQWQWTACLQCHAWARHEDWYVPEDADGD
jgi:hypothetical protein